MSLNKIKEKLLFHPGAEGHYLQKVPEVHKAVIPPSTAETTIADVALTTPIPNVERLKPGTSMWPAETVLYKESFRDIVIAPLYDETLLRPVPILYVAIGFTSARVSNRGANTDENALIPITLHRGYDKTAPMLGYVESIERHAKGTILNTAYDPDPQFKTTILDIGAHLTQQYCEFKFSGPTPEDPAVRTEQVYRWKQCEHHPAVVALCRDRPLPSHDWCKIDQMQNERGMCLFRYSKTQIAAEVAAEAETKKSWGFGKGKKPKLEDGEMLAIFVAGKSHSKMNPVKIAARIRWLENDIWSEELKLAAFLAVMTFGEKSRRIGTGGGF